MQFPSILFFFCFRSRINFTKLGAPSIKSPANNIRQEICHLISTTIETLFAKYGLANWRKLAAINASHPKYYAGTYMLMKMTSRFNYSNIFRASFLPLFFLKNILTWTVSREELQITLSYKKAARKMLMKSTLVKWDWRNLLGH